MPFTTKSSKMIRSRAQPQCSDVDQYDMACRYTTFGTHGIDSKFANEVYL